MNCTLRNQIAIYAPVLRRCRFSHCLATASDTEQKKMTCALRNQIAIRAPVLWRCRFSHCLATASDTEQKKAVDKSLEVAAAPSSQNAPLPSLELRWNFTGPPL